MRGLKFSIFFLFFPSLVLTAQVCSLDSLWQGKNVHDTVKIQDIINYGVEIQKQSLDSALFYYRWANEMAHKNRRSNPKFKELEAKTFRFIGNTYWRMGKNDLAVENINNSVAIYGEIKEMIQKADNLNAIGVIYASQGRFEEANAYFQQFLEVGQELNDQNMIAKGYNNIGLTFWNRGVYDKAIEFFLLATEINEALGNKNILGGNYSNIGNIHKQQGNLDKALEYYLKALEINLEIDNKQFVAGCYNNIGAVFAEKGKNEKDSTSRLDNFDKAIDFYSKALEFSESLNDKRIISMCYNNIGSAFYEKGKALNQTSEKVIFFEKAEVNFLKSQNLKQEMGDKNGLAMINDNLAALHIDLAETISSNSTERKKYLHSALMYAEKSMDFAVETKSISRQNETAKTIMKAHRALGNLDKALEYADMYISTRDSLFSKEKTEALTEMETRYQTEKQQQEIEKQRILIEKHSFTRKAFIVGLVLTIMLAFAIWVGYLLKRRANQQIWLKNADLEQANAEILAQRDEIETQRDMVVSQRDKLEEFHDHITNSLRYAQSIQAAILPSQKILNEISQNHFVFMRPCELVSGDFFWATTFNEHQIFCVADCTGHGVPGALMSILGISALNEIVSRYRVTKASEILGYLRTSVVDALSQNNPDHLHKDGMDIGLCVFNIKTNELQFAGARIPLWIIAKAEVTISFGDSVMHDSISQNGFSLTEIKANIMPVGISPKMDPFDNFTINLNHNPANLFMATDGFADQFGGENRSKFSAVRLKKLLLSLEEKPFSEKGKTIESEFNGWKGDENQIDDVVVLGLRLGANT